MWSISSNSGVYQRSVFSKKLKVVDFTFIHPSGDSFLVTKIKVCIILD